MIIGTSITEAISWSQDRLRSTRPEAERALFSLMKCKIVVETARGYEYDDDEDDKDEDARLRRLKHHVMKAKPAYNSPRLRRTSRQYNERKMLHAEKQRLMAREPPPDRQSDEADDMLDADEQKF